MNEDKKKPPKGTLKSILIGLVVGLVLCMGVYVILTVIYKDAGTSVVSGSGTDTTPNDEVGKDTTSEMKEVDITSNAAHVAAMTASDTLLPQKAEELFTIDAPTLDISIEQGGCTDGTYFYQAFIEKDTMEAELYNKCVIVKYDMASKKVVATSEVMQLNHVNDMTINTKLGYLVVCHNAPSQNLVTYINPETLELVDTFAIDYFIYSIDYNAARDAYVTGLVGTKTFQILDADFKAVSDVIEPTKRSNSSTTQGGACSDDYIYFILYKPNIVTVYDWDGNFVTLIELDTVISPETYEPENLTVIDGEMYIGCGQSTATVFKLSDFVPKPAETEEG